LRVKARINFGLTPAEILNSEFTKNTQLQLGSHYIPHIKDINITWSYTNRNTIAQISYPLSEEPKVKRITEKYGGKFIEVRPELNQMQITETNLTSRGQEQFIEIVDEVIGKNGS